MSRVKTYWKVRKVRKMYVVIMKQSMITQETQKKRNCDSDNLCVICRFKKFHSKTLVKLGDIFYENYVKIYK